MEHQLAFFDIDGTLSAPRYQDKGGNMVIGFSDAEWLDYCAQTGTDGYRFCSPVPCVRAYCTRLKEEGCRLFVLSTVSCEAESAAKETFIRTHYAGVFEDLLFVEHDSEKLAVIERLAKKHGAALSACVLVEDTYSTLLKAQTMGICAVHISNLAATQ